MDTFEMKFDVTLPKTPKPFGDWANHAINNVVSIIEFMHQLQNELDKTDLKVEDIRFREVKERFDPFIVFKLPKNLAMLFYNHPIYDGGTILIQIREIIEFDENEYNPHWLYVTSVECPYIDTWKQSRDQCVDNPIPSKYKHDVDTLISAIDKVIEDHSVEKIDT